MYKLKLVLIAALVALPTMISANNLLEATAEAEDAASARQQALRNLAEQFSVEVTSNTLVKSYYDSGNFDHSTSDIIDTRTTATLLGAKTEVNAAGGIFRARAWIEPKTSLPLYVQQLSELEGSIKNSSKSDINGLVDQYLSTKAYEKLRANTLYISSLAGEELSLSYSPESSSVLGAKIRNQMSAPQSSEDALAQLTRFAFEDESNVYVCAPLSALEKNLNSSSLTGKLNSGLNSNNQFNNADRYLLPVVSGDANSITLSMKLLDRSLTPVDEINISLNASLLSATRETANNLLLLNESHEGFESDVNYSAEVIASALSEEGLSLTQANECLSTKLYSKEEIAGFYGASHILDVVTKAKASKIVLRPDPREHIIHTAALNIEVFDTESGNSTKLSARGRERAVIETNEAATNSIKDAYKKVASRLVIALR